MTISPIDLAKKYCVDDIPSATIPGTQLRPILEFIEAGRPLGAYQFWYLEKKGLGALHRLASGALEFDAFRSICMAEQESRVAIENQRLKREEDERRRRSAELAANAEARVKAIWNAPSNRRRLEAKALKARYGIGFVEPDIYRRFMALLRQVDAGQSLASEDLGWLSTEADDSWTPEFRKAAYRLKAEESTASWKRTGNPWDAVAASSDWRKAELPAKALTVTEEGLAATPQPTKERSALCTTRGGAMRDLKRYSDAIDLALESHKITPNDFHPCTLLGAVHMELGDHKTGAAWYEKAEALGASRGAVDQEIRSLFARASREERGKLRVFLLSKDAERFAWARDLRNRRRA